MLSWILQFLGWLWFFLFWMVYLEQVVSSFSNWWFKNLLKHFTSSVMKSFSSWVLITTLLQSSSVVSVLVLAFVWTWVLSLTSALAVILGSNVWTMLATSVLWVIGLSLNVAVIAFPLIFIGAIWMNFLSRWDTVVTISKFLLSFWLIFLAFSFMKDWLTFFTDIDFSLLAWMSSWIFFFVWLLLSMLVQSWSLIFIIALTAVSAWILVPEFAFPMVIWTYLWSTFTIILWALGKNKAEVKKQVAVWHVGFNLITSVVWMFCLPWIVKAFYYIEPKLWIVIGFTVIYVLWRTVFAFLFIPLVSPVSKLLQKWIKPKQHELQLAIHNLIKVNELDPSVTLLAAKQDMLLLFWNAMKYNLNAWDFSISSVDPEATVEDALASTLWFKGNFDKNDLSKVYHDIKYIQNELIEFLVSLPTSDKSTENATLYQSVIAVLDSCKTIKDVWTHIEDRQWSSSDNLKKDYEDMRKLVLVFYSSVMHLYQNLSSKKALSDAQETLEMIQRENDDYFAELHSHKNDDISLTALIQTRRYFAQSCSDLLYAMELCHLEPDEVKHFKETVVPFMK